MKKPPTMNPQDQTAQEKRPLSVLARLKQLRSGWMIGLISLVFSAFMAGLLLAVIACGIAGRPSFPVRHAPAALLLNLLIFCIIFAGLHGLTNRWTFSAVLLSCASFFAALIHIAKIRMLGIPLLPGDVIRPAGFLKTMLPVFKTHWLFFGLLALLVFLSFPLYLWAWRRRWLRGSWRYRLIALCVAALCAWGTLSFEARLKAPDGAGSRITWIDWNQKENYNKNGFFLAFTTHVLFLVHPLQPPAGYSEARIDDIYRKYLSTLAQTPATSGTLATVSPGGPVNVVLYQATAFWDVSRLGVQMTSDPTPFFHQLQKTALSGELRAPTYGGHSAKTEFEMLTGCSLEYLPEMSNPYSSYLDLGRPLPTLPRILKEKHYRTVAIYPYQREMWDRARAFPELGFDEFEDINAFKDPQTAGPYISDDSLVDRIIEVSRLAYPSFVYGITVSTHGPYDVYDDYLNAPLDVTTPLSAPSHKLLKTYINALARADGALKKLIEHFSRESKKTLIIIYGDHLPLLGDDLAVYKETGYLKRTDVFSDKMLTPPLVIWANYPLPRVNISRDAHQVLPLILRLAGVEPGNYGKFIESATLASARERKGAPSRLAEDSKAVQYDMLFGRDYALNLEHTPLENIPLQAAAAGAAGPGAARPASVGPGHAITIKAYGPVAAIAGDSFNVQADGSSALWFQTEPVTPETKVALNGMMLPTILDKTRTFITATMNRDNSLAPGDYRLYLYDSKTGTRSSEVTFKVYPPGSSVPGLLPNPKPRANTTAIATPSLDQPAVKSWGPQVTNAGKDFNSQSGGHSALWFVLERPMPRVTVIFGDTPLETFVGGDGAVSANVPAALYAQPGEYPIVILNQATGKKSGEQIFRVYPAGALIPKVLPTVKPTATPDPSLPVVTNWGPQTTAEGVAFNPQPNGNSAMWFILEHPLPKVTVVFNGTPLETHVGSDGAVSAAVPKNLYAKSGDYPVVIKDNPSGKISAPLNFVVSNKKP